MDLEKNYHLKGLSDEFIREQHNTHCANFYIKVEELEEEFASIEKMVMNGSDYIDAELLSTKLLLLKMQLESTIDEASAALYYVKR